MALLAYNKTTSALALAAGSPIRTLPASASPGVRGQPVNVTSELKGLSGGDYAALDAQRVANSVDFVWTGGAEYATSGLTTVGSTTAAPITVGAFARFTAPIAAELISIVADVALANGAQTIAGQPDYPRKLQIHITDADSSISAGTVTIVGVGTNGAAVTEAVSLTGGTATKVSVNAYAHVTSATVAGLTGATGVDHISIGVGAALGLPCAVGASSFAVFKENDDNADATIGTVDATAGTITTTAAPNATHNYSIYYTYQVTPGLV